ncbi:MAG: hypothetical protein KKB79_03195 [Nanoarchaeota archaeon]|nr:hypothetical protein [Nanoarchaeota archaeon]
MKILFLDNTGLDEGFVGVMETSRVGGVIYKDFKDGGRVILSSLNPKGGYFYYFPDVPESL